MEAEGPDLQNSHVYVRMHQILLPNSYPETIPFSILLNPGSAPAYIYNDRILHLGSDDGSFLQYSCLQYRAKRLIPVHFLNSSRSSVLQ